MSANQRKPEPPPGPDGLAVRLARLADERNCSNVLALDVRGISPVTEYFVIAAGTSTRQLRTVADEMTDAAAALGERLFSVEGRDAATWILLDFIDVVVHLFDEPSRRFYDLELLWGDAPRVQWNQEG